MTSVTVTINLEPLVPLTDDAFYTLCRANPEVKFERTSVGELVVMPPTGGETGNRNIKLSARLENWAEQDGTGLAFDSSTMFQLPNSAYRSPDAAWILLKRWEVLASEERQAFPPICPDFVVELRSPSDTLKAAQNKMQEYMDNGARLGWLINPINARRHSLWFLPIKTSGIEARCLLHPQGPQSFEIVF